MHSHPASDSGEPDPELTLTHKLIARYLEGDRVAEHGLFKKHSELLLNRARAHPWMSGLRAHLSPEDVVDEVFLRALSSGLLREFDARSRGSLKRVLFKILDRVLVDLFRRHGAVKRRLPPLLSGSGEEAENPKWSLEALVPSDTTTPTSNARATELLELCRQHLSPREWEVWRRVEVDGLGADGTAQALGLTPSAVRSLMFRARAKLLALFTEPTASAEPDEREGP